MTVPREHEAALMMGVTEKDGLEGEGLESRKGLIGADDVLVFVRRGAVHDLEPVQ